MRAGGTEPHGDHRQLDGDSGGGGAGEGPRTRRARARPRPRNGGCLNNGPGDFHQGVVPGIPLPTNTPSTPSRRQSAASHGVAIPPAAKFTTTGSRPSTYGPRCGGYRWALDPGSDNYDLPGYFAQDRWTYYRLRTEGHNTLTLDDQNQNVAGKAPIVAFHSEKDRAFAVADLSDAYRGKATRVQRGVAILRRQMVLVQDEIAAAEPVAVAWNLHTPAKIELHADGATLTQDKAVLRLRVLAPQGVKFEVRESSGPPPQAQSPQVHNLVIRLPQKVQETRIVVLFSPGEAPAAAPGIEPLEAWIKAAKP